MCPGGGGGWEPGGGGGLLSGSGGDDIISEDGRASTGGGGDQDDRTMTMSSRSHVAAAGEGAAPAGGKRPASKPAALHRSGSTGSGSSGGVGVGGRPFMRNVDAAGTVRVCLLPYVVPARTHAHTHSLLRAGGSRHPRTYFAILCSHACRYPAC